MLSSRSSRRQRLGGILVLSVTACVASFAVNIGANWLSFVVIWLVGMAIVLGGYLRRESGNGSSRTPVSGRTRDWMVATCVVPTVLWAGYVGMRAPSGGLRVSAFAIAAAWVGIVARLTYRRGEITGVVLCVIWSAAITLHTGSVTGRIESTTAVWWIALGTGASVAVIVNDLARVNPASFRVALVIAIGILVTAAIATSNVLGVIATAWSGMSYWLDLSRSHGSSTRSRVS